MIKNVIIILMLGLISACQQYPDPYIETLVKYSFIKSGSDQKSYAGNYLNDSIGLYVSNSLAGTNEVRIQVQFEVIDGGGEVDHSTIITNANGSAYTNWKLGEEASGQTVRAKIFDSSDKLLSEINFRAFGFKDNEWNTVSVQPDNDILDMVADTARHLTFMTTNHGLYKQEANYFDWEQINTININDPRIIEIDSEGTLYLGNSSGDLSKSENNCITWVACTKPIQDASNFKFAVTSNNFIWATARGYPLQCSRDGGETWSIDSAGLGSNKLMLDIFRLNTGAYFLLALNSDLHKPELFKSEYDSEVWKPVQDPRDPIKLYVTEKDEIIVYGYYDGFSINKSIDMGNHFTKVYQTNPKFAFMNQAIQKTKDFYYVLVPGKGILKTRDFNTFKLYWYKLYLSNLFMDHSGVLIAKDVDRDNVYYRRNSD